MADLTLYHAVPSPADVMMGATIMWGTQLMSMLPAHPEIVEYWQRLEQRPAWQHACGADQKIMAAKETTDG